jgi:hypothetical protein
MISKAAFPMGIEYVFVFSTVVDITQGQWCE